MSRGTLIAANAALLALLLLHTLDHGLRHPDGAIVPEGASVLGTAGFVAVALALLLALMGERHAPEVTALVGFGTAIGFLAVHVLPDWAPLSQPYADIGVDALSWVSMLVTAGCAALVGLVGLRERGSRRAAQPA